MKKTTTKKNPPVAEEQKAELFSATDMKIVRLQMDMKIAQEMIGAVSNRMEAAIKRVEDSIVKLHVKLSDKLCASVNSLSGRLNALEIREPDYDMSLNAALTHLEDGVTPYIYRTASPDRCVRITPSDNDRFTFSQLSLTTRSGDIIEKIWEIKDSDKKAHDWCSVARNERPAQPPPSLPDQLIGMMHRAVRNKDENDYVLCIMSYHIASAFDQIATSVAAFPDNEDHLVVNLISEAWGEISRVLGKSNIDKACGKYFEGFVRLVNNFEYKPQQMTAHVRGNKNLLEWQGRMRKYFGLQD